MAIKETTTSDFSFRNAKEFIDFVRSEDSNLYLFLSKSSPWENDSFPPMEDISQSNKHKIWDEMTVLKKVRPQDVVRGIKRIDWQAGTVYAQYDDTIDLKDRNFYIFTPEKNIYLCIDNNNDSPSLNLPNHKNIAEIKSEPDGYRWKYIATVSNSLLDKYVIPTFVPFQENSLVKESSIPGTIDRIKVVDPGLGYEENEELPLFIQGNGNQFGDATIDIQAPQGSIASFTIENGGSGNYEFSPGIPFPVAIRQVTSDGVVQNAYGIASTNIQGEIFDLKIIKAGNGYVTSGEKGVLIQSSAEGIVTTSENGSITSASITKPGENFFKAEIVVMTEKNPVTRKAELEPVISPAEGFGKKQFEDLFANFLLFSVRLDSISVLNTISLDEFRIIGLIDSPISFDPDSADLEYKEDVGDPKARLKIDSSNAAFQEGEEIVGEISGARGKNLSLFKNDILRYTVFDDFFPAYETLDFQVGETVKGMTSGATSTVLETIDPDILKYSGDIYNINNVRPIRFNENQNILATFVLKY